MKSAFTQLCLLGCNHQTAPLEMRERIALTEGTHRALYEVLHEHADFQESLVLHTCNRLEIYAVGNGTTPLRLRELLGEVTGIDPAIFIEYGYDLCDAEVVQHLFQVASGLNSQLIGETEIFGQVKAAYDEACQRGTTGPILHRLLQKSFQAGKWARTHTAICQGQISLGNITVELAERVFGSLQEANALVVGTGQVGRDVAKALRSRGLGAITVTSRKIETAAAVAKEVGGVPLPFDCWHRALENTNIAIFATSAPNTLLSASDISAIMQIRGGDPLFLIDLAVPRDVEASVGLLDSVFLYDLEDLSSIANANRKLRENEVNQCREILIEKATHFWDRNRPKSSS